MDAASFEADLSDPHPERTIKQKKSQAAPAPEPKKDIEPTKPAEEPAGELGLEEGTPPTEGKPEEAAPPADKASKEPLLDEKGKPIDKTKISPWKLVDKFKERALSAEARAIAAEERIGKMADVEQSLKRIEAVEARNKELEEEIKYQNFSKSKEYEEKYQKPYEAAWAKAAKELGELEVLDESGAVSRRANSQDLIALANMPLGQARKTATAMFGDSANDVMLHRQRIIDLSEAQREALDTARKSGTERTEQSTLKQQAIAKEVATHWEAANTEAASRLEYLKAKEGDTEWNGAITKAQGMVDRAFGRIAEINNPNLPPEERAKIIKEYSAARNRAIAYSPLKLENTRLRAELAKRDEKLKQYEESEPTAGNGSREASKETPAGDPMARAMQRLKASAVQAPSTFF